MEGLDDEDEKEFKVVRQRDTLLPSDDEIRLAAYYLWKNNSNENEVSNWYKARLTLLAERVWQNPYLRHLIYSHVSQRDLILTFMKIDEAHDKEIAKMLVFFAKKSWQESTKGKFGEAQIVINQTRGQLVMTPKKHFHPIDVFDMFDD